MKLVEKIGPILQKLSRNDYLNRIKLKDKFDYTVIRKVLVPMSLLHSVRDKIPKLGIAVHEMYSKFYVNNVKKILVPSLQTTINKNKPYVSKMLISTNNSLQKLVWKVRDSRQISMIRNRIVEFDERNLGVVKYLEPRATNVIKHLEPKLTYLSLYCQNRVKKVDIGKYWKKIRPTTRVPLETKITKMTDEELLRFKRALRIHLASKSKPYPVETETKLTFIMGKKPDEIVRVKGTDEIDDSVEDGDDDKKQGDSKVTFIGVDLGETVSSIGSSVGSKVSSMGSSVGSSVSSMGTSVGSSVSSLRHSVSSGFKNISFPHSLYDIPFSKSSQKQPPPDSPSVPTVVPNPPKHSPRQAKAPPSPSSLWTKPMYTKSTVDELTKHWVGSLHLVSTNTPCHHELVQTLEMFSKHLAAYPWANALAKREQAVGHLLNIQKRDLSGEVNILCRECLSRLGHPRPLSGPGIRILSIDGGGMRGLIALEVLSKLEEATGKKVHQMFDLICGVSTGSILASLLSFHRKSAGEVTDIYQTIGQKVFTQHVLSGAKGVLLKHAYYDADAYEKILKEFVGESVLFDTMRSENTPAVALVSTLVSDTRVEPYVFRNYAFPPRVQPSFRGSNSDEIWVAVRASSSAPGYFNDFSLNGEVHQDGGVMANNPTQIAIREAQCLWPGEELQCVVSLGLGRYQPMSQARAKNPKNQLSLAQKFSRFVDSATDTELMHETIQGLLPQGVYYRFNPHLSEHTALDETRQEKMDQMREDSKMYIRRNSEKLDAASKTLTTPVGVGQRVVRAARDLRVRGIAAVTPHPAIRYFL